MKNLQRNNGFGLLRVAAISPVVTVGDVRSIAHEIEHMARAHANNGAQLIVFPELCLAGGYTNADLFHQSIVQKGALANLETLVAASTDIEAILVVGMPLMVNTTLFNVAAVIDRGRVVGFVPKSYLPTGGEFYEGRWFGSAHDLTVIEIPLWGEMVPIGTDLLFQSQQHAEFTLAVEICEDLWTPLPPSSFAAVAGATIIVNLSASNELVGKADYRRQLVQQQSGRCICGYVYCSAGAGESTTDVVFSGHCLIGENGSIIRESDRLSSTATTVIGDLDIEACVKDRMRTTSFAKSAVELRNRPVYRRLGISLSAKAPQFLARPNHPHPFVPSDKDQRNDVCADVFNIQSLGLAHRLQKTSLSRLVLGLSGGLDSTLALLACIRACKRQRLNLSETIRPYTLPGFGTTVGTKANAHALAAAAGLELEEISIKAGTKRVLRNINHSMETEDITFENAQARYRTLLLMQKANQIGGIVVGTGDLSEAALGWCTYNGDQMSHYNVNCSIPKTLVRFVVEWVAENESTPELKKVLLDILATPISPELTAAKKGRIAQKTEDILGPYELLDFFLYQFIRRGSSPRKIVYLAQQAFGQKYTQKQITTWLEGFITRFFRSQFKRSAMPDGPKVGSVSLSQRGDWRMPSDAEPTSWLDDLHSV